MTKMSDFTRLYAEALCEGADEAEVEGLLKNPVMQMEFDTTRFQWLQANDYGRYVNHDQQVKLTPYIKPPWGLDISPPCRKSVLAGHSVLQFCPVCKAHQITGSRGIYPEHIDWGINPPAWADRTFELFVCVGGHSFRSYNKPVSPARPPAPGT